MDEDSQPTEHADGVLLEPADAADPSYRQPPAGHLARRPADADLPLIADLYRRAARTSSAGTMGRGALVTEADLRRTWTSRRNDALVVTDETSGAIVGYLEFHESMDPWTPALDAYAEGRVDPGAGRHGVGTFLLGRALDRARSAAQRHPEVPTSLRTTLVDPAPETLALFERYGMTSMRHMLQLRLDLGPDLPAPVWPAGIRAVPATDIGLPALHAALVAAFSDHHLGATEDFDTWRRVVVDRGRVALDASVVALAAGVSGTAETPVGVALGVVGAEGEPGLAAITDLGVVPEHRGHGLATAVLRAEFQRLRELGADRVGLDVDDVTMDGALRLYQRAGMDVVHHTVVLTSDPL